MKCKETYVVAILLFMLLALAGSLPAQTPDLTKAEQKDLKILQLQQQVLGYQAQELQTALAQYNTQRKSLEKKDKDFVTSTLKAHKLDPEKYTVNLQAGVIVLVQQPSKTALQKKDTK